MRWLALGTCLLLTVGCTGGRWPFVSQRPLLQENDTPRELVRESEREPRAATRTLSSTNEPPATPVDNPPPVPPSANPIPTTVPKAVAADAKVDPQTHERLLNDLSKIDPAYRPLVMRLLNVAMADGSPATADASAASPVSDVEASPGPEVPAAAPPKPRKLPQQTAPQLAVPPRRTVPPVVTDPPNAALARAEVPAAAPPSQTSPPPVVTVVSDEPPPTATSAVAASEPRTWQQELTITITRLEQELAALPEKDPGRARGEALLRLLHLVAGDKDAAVKTLAQTEPWQRDYWKHQLHALSVYLDEEGTPVNSRRAALALRELREAGSQLATASALDVRNLAFCSRVDSYGRYTEFPKSEFKPNQEILLYAEIDHVTSTSVPEGFEAKLQGSYQVFDASGRRVAEHAYPVETDLARTRRRDYFIPYRVYLPKQIEPGKYTLQLTVEDVAGRKFGQGTIPFSVLP